MPIPTKSLREMLTEAMWPWLVDEHATEMVDAAMAVLREYDPCFADAAENGEPTFTLRARDLALAAGAPETEPSWFDSEQEAQDAMRAWPNRKLPD